MPEILQLAIGTVSSRPYVFAFFAAFLLAAVPQIGWKRVFLFTLSGYLTAFASEFSSINTGFPYGWYYYIDNSSSRELWIAGVPFFDSLSYVFLCYCSYATALFILSPLKRTGLNLMMLDTIRIRRSFAALLLGALLQTWLDIIIDPVALQGEKWFLGRIYGYREVGHHFGVPLTNYAGWFAVSLVMIFILQRLSYRAGAGSGKKPAGIASLPNKALLPVVLYISVVIFNIAIAYSIKEYTIAISGLFASLLPAAIVLILALRRVNRYSRDELAEHLKDFPGSFSGDKVI